MQSGTPSFFVAGIIQGSLSCKGIHSQAYRERIRAILRARFPNSRITDPLELRPDSVNYRPAKAGRVFIEHIKIVSGVAILVCYLQVSNIDNGAEAMYEPHKSVSSHEGI